MSWTNPQKALAARAAASAGLTSDQRLMVLSGPAYGNRAIHSGKVTSTSPRLTNADFEEYMAHVEQLAGGTILGFAKGHWEFRRSDAGGRYKQRILRLIEVLRSSPGNLLDDSRLIGWIRTMSNLAAQSIEDLQELQLRALLQQMEVYAHRHGIKLDGEPAAAPGGEIPF